MFIAQKRMGIMTRNQHDKSIGSIPLLYRALEDPAFWESALGALADELRADHVVLDLQADLAPKIVATRVAPNHIAQFSSHDEYRQLRGLVDARHAWRGLACRRNHQPKPASTQRVLR